MRKLLLSIAAVLVIAFATGCGSDSSSTDDSVSFKPFRIPTGKVTIRYAKELHPNASGLAGRELKPVMPKGPPPEFIAVADLIDGIGHLFVEGDKVTLQYAGYDYETGEKFASSWDEGKPFTFKLGAGEVSQGWEEGIEGMEIGDRRELVIPAEFADASFPPGIPEGKDVIYVIETLPFSAAQEDKASAAKPAKQAPKAKAPKKDKPKVKLPSGPPPKKLEIKDLEQGSGPGAKAGDEVTVQYVGVNYKNGKEFDASWDRGEPFTFELGSGMVIGGWEQGVEGMKVGGRRELIIPPELGYGAAGSPPAIPPNETLVFVIDLVAIK